MAESLTKALRHTQAKTTQQLAAAFRPYTNYKQGVDEWDAGRASAEMAQNSMTLEQLAAVVRSLSSRIDAAAHKVAPDNITRRVVARTVNELLAAINDLQSVAVEPTHMMAAE